VPQKFDGSTQRKAAGHPCSMTARQRLTAWRSARRRPRTCWPCAATTE
jgi:hypothetical protein